jgi:hypothetical protein
MPGDAEVDCTILSRRRTTIGRPLKRRSSLLATSSYPGRRAGARGRSANSPTDVFQYGDAKV